MWNSVANHDGNENSARIKRERNFSWAGQFKQGEDFFAHAIFRLADAIRTFYPNLKHLRIWADGGMRSKADLNLIGALAHMTGVEIQVHFSAPNHGHNRCDRYFGNLKRLLRSTNPGVDWSSHLKSIPEAIEIMKSFGDPAFHHFEYMTQPPVPVTTPTWHHFQPVKCYYCWDFKPRTEDPEKAQIFMQPRIHLNDSIRLKGYELDLKSAVEQMGLTLPPRTIKYTKWTLSGTVVVQELANPPDVSAVPPNSKTKKRKAPTANPANTPAENHRGAEMEQGRGELMSAPAPKMKAPTTDDA